MTCKQQSVQESGRRCASGRTLPGASPVEIHGQGRSGVATSHFSRSVAAGRRGSPVRRHKPFQEYHLTYLLPSGQYIIPAISDPFGFGWNIFGTAAYKPDIGLVDARFAWYVGVIALVAGHVIAVYLVHRTAIRLFCPRRRALASQFPMLVLMVVYTMPSLWIIAQPTVQ